MILCALFFLNIFEKKEMIKILLVPITFLLACLPFSVAFSQDNEWQSADPVFKEVNDNVKKMSEANAKYNPAYEKSGAKKIADDATEETDKNIGEVYPNSPKAWSDKLKDVYEGMKQKASDVKNHFTSNPNISNTTTDNSAAGNSSNEDPSPSAFSNSAVVPASNNTSSPSNKLSEEHAKQINNVPPLNESDFNAMPSDLQTKILNENIHQQEIQRNQDEEFKTVSTESALLKASVPPSADPNVLNADDLDRMDPSTRSKVLKSMLPGNPESEGSVRISSANEVDQSQGKAVINDVNNAPPAANDIQPIENVENHSEQKNSTAIYFDKDHQDNSKQENSSAIYFDNNSADKRSQNNTNLDPLNVGNGNSSSSSLDPTGVNTNSGSSDYSGSAGQLAEPTEADMQRLLRDAVMNNPNIPSDMKQEVLSKTLEIANQNGGMLNIAKQAESNPQQFINNAEQRMNEQEQSISLPENNANQWSPTSAPTEEITPVQSEPAPPAPEVDDNSCNPARNHTRCGCPGVAC